MTEFDAILLTGGQARRLGGVDKPALEVGGRALARRVADAVSGAVRLIVVGPDHADVRADVVTSENPPGGGPLAAIVAGIGHVQAPYVVVLAADMPFLTAEVISELLAALDTDPTASVALPVDETRRTQNLTAVWRSHALRDALTVAGPDGWLTGRSVRHLLAATDVVIRRPFDVKPGEPPPWFDCDTEDDIAQAREWARRQSL
jgi:molybdenum cofactor guanylyltransferase